MNPMSLVNHFVLRQHEKNLRTIQEVKQSYEIQTAKKKEKKNHVNKKIVKSIILNKLKKRNDQFLFYSFHFSR